MLYNDRYVNLFTNNEQHFKGSFTTPVKPSFNLLSEDSLQRDCSNSNIILFTGNYGSGKTEVSVNFAIMLARQNFKVKIADLDIVNPYFRSREARKILEKEGIEVVAPEGELHNADLPIVLPQVRAMIEDPNGMNILDVGGDPVGATVVASLKNAFELKTYEMYFVLNQKRPFTSTIDGAVQLIREVEYAASMKVTAIISNTHLLDETTLEMIYEGAEFAMDVAKKIGVPLKYVVIPENLFHNELESESRFQWLRIQRILVLPWKTVQPYEVALSRNGFARKNSISL